MKQKNFTIIISEDISTYQLFNKMTDMSHFIDGIITIIII